MSTGTEIILGLQEALDQASIKEYRLTTAPPSLNNNYATVHGKGRVKSARYKAWITEAGLELKKQGIRPVESPYAVNIKVGRKLSRADIDNLIKPIVDLLVKMGATPDDRKLEQVCITRSERDDVLIWVRRVWRTEK